MSHQHRLVMKVNRLKVLNLLNLLLRTSSCKTIFALCMLRHLPGRDFIQCLRILPDICHHFAMLRFTPPPPHSAADCRAETESQSSTKGRLLPKREEARPGPWQPVVLEAKPRKLLQARARRADGGQVVWWLLSWWWLVMVDAVVERYRF